MNKRYIKIINIVLIFIIIIGMGMTTVFAEEVYKTKEELFAGLQYKAATWNKKDINNFLNEYGGFPKGLPEKVRDAWKKKYIAADDGSYEPVPDKLKSESDVEVTEDRLREAAQRIINRELTADEWYWIAEQQSPGSNEQDNALNNAANATANFVNEMNVVNKKIYKQPSMNEPQTSSGSLSDMMNDADAFVSVGNTEVVSGNDLQGISNVLYNILLEVGITIAVIVGGIIGIKFMMASVEEKAQYKELLVPYVVGCIIVFGSFAIWKIAVTLFANI